MSEQIEVIVETGPDNEAEVISGGASGPPGIQGPQGDKGDQGDTGPQGVKGDPGDAGPAGDPGAPGAPGAAGAVGPKGDKGDKGDPGDDGAPGAPGAPGATGPEGPTGPQGDPGADGADGAPGAPGATGDVGPEGPEGPEGPQGIQGIPGAAGATGPGFTYRGLWASGTAYAVNDVVLQGSNLWICIAAVAGATVPTLDAVHWALYVRGVRWLGAWASGTTYYTNDLVSYNGSTYITTATSVTGVGNDPVAAPASWQLVASKGDAGAAGAAGATGPGSTYIYGDGSDLDITISTQVVIARPMNYNNLTVTGTGEVQPRGWPIRVKNTLTLASGARFTANGSPGSASVGGAGAPCDTTADFGDAGTTGLVGQTGGSGAAAVANAAAVAAISFPLGGTGGGGGGGGSAGGTAGGAGNQSTSAGGTGGTTGTGGGSGGAGGAASFSQVTTRAKVVAGDPQPRQQSGVTRACGGTGGGGGGGGNSGQGSGAGGGAGAGAYHVYARHVVGPVSGTATFEAKAGAGTLGGTNAGGGGGGGGGYVGVFTEDAQPATVVFDTSGGNGGGANGNGKAGGAGGAGWSVWVRGS